MQTKPTAIAHSLLTTALLCAAMQMPSAGQAATTSATTTQTSQKDTAMEKHYLTDPAKILVRKDGGAVFALSRFKEGTNIATCFIEGNENTFLLPAAAPLEDIWKGRIIAESWDNMGPMWFDKHGILGANHGSPFTFRIQILRHWLFNKDIGAVLTDDAGQKFVLVAIDDLCSFKIHSDIPAPGGTFASSVKGALHIDGRTIVPESVTKTQMSNMPGGQLSPHQRYNNVRLLINGTQPAADRDTIECDFAALHWDMDLIFPEALLRFIKDHPGQRVSPTDPRLANAIHYDMTTTFRPCGARTVDCDLTFLEDIADSMRYGMLQFYGGIAFGSHERLMPGMNAVSLDGQTIDLGRGFTFPKEQKLTRWFTQADAIHPSRLPNRCIDFFGNNGTREVGVALGYSETQGTTARGNEAERGNPLLYLFPTTKIYTFALAKTQLKKGDAHHISAYQQYFAPDPSGVSCYHHQRADGYFVYADFPAPAQNYEIQLPAALAGKTLDIVERDDAVAPAVSAVSPRGTIGINATAQGGIVLKIK